MDRSLLGELVKMLQSRPDENERFSLLQQVARHYPDDTAIHSLAVKWLPLRAGEFTTNTSLSTSKTANSKTCGESQTDESNISVERFSSPADLPDNRRTPLCNEKGTSERMCLVYFPKKSEEILKKSGRMWCWEEIPESALQSAIQDGATRVFYKAGDSRPARTVDLDKSKTIWQGELEPEQKQPERVVSPAFVLGDMWSLRLARAAGGAGLFDQICVYFIGRLLSSRNHEGQGSVHRSELFTALNETYSFDWTRRHFNRVLCTAPGQLWGVDEKGNVHFRSLHKKVVPYLEQIAREKDPELVSGLEIAGGERPSGMLGWVNLTGSHQERIAHVYRAWKQRRNRRGAGGKRPLVSLDVECRLWGVSSPNTIRNWTKSAKLHRQAVFSREKIDGQHKRLPSIVRVPKVLQVAFKHRKSRLAQRLGRAVQFRSANLPKTRTPLKLYFHTPDHRKALTAAVKNGRETGICDVRRWQHAHSFSSATYGRIRLMDCLL